MSRFWRHFITNGSARLAEDHLGLFGRGSTTPASGLKVRWVRAGSPAMQAGLQQGDILQSIDETPVRGLAGLERLLLDLPVGVPLAIAFLRGERLLTRWLILAEHSDQAYPSPRE